MESWKILKCESGMEGRRGREGETPSKQSEQHMKIHVEGEIML
jgi:hypothetical protein